MRPLLFVLFLLPILGDTKPAGGKKKGCAGTNRVIPEDEICPPLNETTAQRMDLRLRNTFQLPYNTLAQPRIFGGENAKDGEFEGQVQFIAYNGITKEADVCGGIVLSEWAFATNAHCVFPYVKSVPLEIQLFVYQGSIHFASGDQYHIHHIYLHPEFEHFPNGDFENDNDLALVAVLEPFPASSIAAIPDKPKKSGSICLASGFGSTTYQGRFTFSRANILQKRSVTVLKKFVEGIDNSFFGTEGPAKGDSGNALLCPVASGRKVVTGLQTGIATDAEGEELPLFLDIFYFGTWLNEQIAAIKRLKIPKDL